MTAWRLIDSEDFPEKSGKILMDHKGFTLLEIIIALSILAIGILAVASMQLTSIRGNAFACNQTEATTLASDRIEKLIALPYAHSDLSAGTHTDQNPPGAYSIAWTVADDSPINNTKTVTVTITWKDHGVQKSVSMQRIVPRII